MGGLQALKWATHYPDRVHSCIAIACNKGDKQCSKRDVVQSFKEFSELCYVKVDEKNTHTNCKIECEYVESDSMSRKGGSLLLPVPGCIVPDEEKGAKDKEYCRQEYACPVKYYRCPVLAAEWLKNCFFSHISTCR